MWNECVRGVDCDSSWSDAIVDRAAGSNGYCILESISKGWVWLSLSAGVGAAAGFDWPDTGRPIGLEKAPSAHWGVSWYLYSRYLPTLTDFKSCDLCLFPMGLVFDFSFFCCVGAIAAGRANRSSGRGVFVGEADGGVSSASTFRIPFVLPERHPDLLPLPAFSP